MPLAWLSLPPAKPPASKAGPEARRAITMSARPTKTALLVIDVQQGLCEGEQEAFESQAVIARINQVAEKARSAGAFVVFVQHEGSSGYLDFGSDAWQLARGLRVEAGDLRIRKTTPDAFHRTELQSLLERHAVSDLVIGGMHTEFCVDTTTRRALALGYPVVLVEDAHTTRDNAHLSAAQIIRHHNATLTNISSFGPRVRAVSAHNLRIAG
jgi:nicotinamidase-related amidase